jgi:hypothetical protein
VSIFESAHTGILWLSPLRLPVEACGTVIDAGIGAGGGRGIMLPMSQPDPGASA